MAGGRGAVLWKGAERGASVGVESREMADLIRVRGRCDADLPFADLTSTSEEDGDLGSLFWIQHLQSYICLEPVGERLR